MAERKYQIQQIDDAIQQAILKQKVCIQLPTGGGKTYEFALLAQRFIRNTDQSVLIIVHRQELLNQACKTVKSLTGYEPYLITSDTKKFKISRVYIGMEGSVINRLNLIHNVGLLIIDECHMNNFTKFHRAMPDILILGYTATPISASKKEPLNKYYNAIVTGPQIYELIQMGYLAQNYTRCPKDRVDASLLAIDKKSGDYDDGKMAIEYKKPRYITNVIFNYQKYCLGKKTLVFNVTIEHSKAVNDNFKLFGYNSRHIDSDSSNRPSSDARFSNEREEILHWFKVTPDAILNNVMIATVGFDEPTIERVIPNFSTLSIVKYIQCCGRGGRIIDQEFIDKYQKDYPYKLELKEDFEIIDMGGNAVSGIGDWSDDRDWKYIFNNPEQPPKEGGVAPKKICPACEGLVHMAVRFCACRNSKGEICNYEFERKDRREEDAQDMVLVTKLNIPNLIQKTTKKYDLYLFMKLAEPVIKDMFETYDNPNETVIQRGFNNYYDLVCEWWKQSLGKTDGNLPDITDSSFHIRKARIHYEYLIEQARRDNVLKLQKNVELV